MKILYKEFPVEIKSFDFSSDGPGSFEGYASVFGNKDAVNEIVTPGAFNNIDEFVKDGFGAVGHNWGVLPIATITEAKQDDYGLKVKAEFHSIQAAQDARTVIKERLKRGKSVKLSIGYVVQDFEDTQDARLLKSIKVYEFSFVTVPANNLASVTDAKGLEALDTFSTFADQLSDVLARAQAVKDRAKSIQDLRVKEGRSLSSANRERVVSLKESLANVLSLLEEFLASTDPARKQEQEQEQTQEEQKAHPEIVDATELFLQYQKQLFDSIKTS